MKGIFKILVGVIGILIVLMVAAAVLLPLIYDEEDLKEAIAGEVYEKTGRELSIDGALDFSVFPWLAVDVSDLSLGNAAGFGDQSFARISQARAGVALMPLLRKQIAVDEITLNGLELDLIVNADGVNNWDDLSAGAEGGEETSDASGSSLFSSQTVAGLNIRDARIQLQDHQAGSHYRLSGLSMETGALGQGEPVPLKLSAVIEDLVAGSRTHFSLASTATIDLQAQQFRFDDVDLALAHGTAEASVDHQEILIRAPRVNADLMAQTLQIDTFEAQLGGLQAAGNLSASNILEQPAFNGSFSTSAFSPAGLMQDLQMEAPATADPEALKHASLSSSFTGNSSQLSLSKLEFQLDQSRFTGDMNVNNFDQPRIGFELVVDEIDLDRYMEPASSTAEQENVAMPQEELRGQELDGNLSVGKLRLAGLNFSDARIAVAIRNGRLRLNPLTAGFYGGSYNGDITLDSSSAVPLLSLDEKIESVAFQHLVADLVEAESLSGTAQGHLRLKGRGASSDEVLQSLNGDLGLTLAEGALEGINIWYEIRRGMALYKGLEPPPEEPNRTVFSRVKLAATVDRGVVSTRELLGELPFLTLSGDGTIDLGQSRADLSMLAKVRNIPELSEDPLGSELKGQQMPFKVSGPLDDLAISVDWEALLKSEATDMLLEKLGLKPGSSPDEDTEGETEPASSEDQMKKSAEGALFDLLRGIDKEKEKDGNNL
jgi:AsmA protein